MDSGATEILRMRTVLDIVGTVAIAYIRVSAVDDAVACCRLVASIRVSSHQPSILVLLVFRCSLS